MQFRTAGAVRRPVRLSSETRAWAWESMHGKYGDEAMEHPWLDIDDVEDYASRSTLDRYDAAVRRIAEKAPIRITPVEKIAGSATLGEGMMHHIPVHFGSKSVFCSVSHLTIDYSVALREGVDAYARRIAARLADPALEEDQAAFLRSLEHTVESMRIWHSRYLDATRDTRPDLHAALQQVPFSPARSFREAVQCIWFVFAFTRVCGNWPGIGRIDRLLGDYLRRDLEAGVLIRDEAREILASFFIKGCEWIRSDTPQGTGDAQHYQNIVLSGIDENGREVTNDVTYLVLDIVEELAISDYPITVRLNSRSPEKLLRKVARVMRHGGGILAVYNEDLILRALADNGYDIAEARQFANDGCWEVQIPGRTRFNYFPFDGLQIFNRALGIDGGEIPACAGMEDVYGAFLRELAADMEALFRSQVADQFVCRGGRWTAARETLPSSVISLFEEGCIDRAQDYYALGPVYTVLSPHIGGAPDIANSLLAIQKLVFEEKRLTLPELIGILRRNWEGCEPLRQYVRNRYTYYGNDDDAGDAWETRLLNDFADAVHAIGSKHSEYPVHFVPGVSTFGRQVDWLPMRCATAFGGRKGDILAANASPTPGTDLAGATAMIKSYCKADLARMTTGAALDVKILPETLRGEDGIRALKALMRGFVALGGFFMQIDTVDAATLLDAQAHPEEYKTLSVRVSGWNARFITLQKEWQDMIIERSTQRSL